MTAFFLFLGGVPAPLVAVDGVGPLAEEVAQGGGDHQRVHGAVEAAVATALEAVEEEHDLADAQVGELAGDDVGQFVHLLVGEFVAHAAVLRQVVELRDEPHARHVAPHPAPHLGERGVRAEETLPLVVADAHLEGRAEGFEEACALLRRRDGRRLLRRGGR